MENEHELSYETLKRVYLGSYEHYKSVGVEVEYLEPGFELQGAKMVEMVEYLEAKMKVWRVLEAAAAVVVEREEMWL
ncbi:hypothetical protein Tco_0062862 [Tanacetum coccineum]